MSTDALVRYGRLMRGPWEPVPQTIQLFGMGEPVHITNFGKDQQRRGGADARQAAQVWTFGVALASRPMSREASRICMRKTSKI